ncbi:MAG: NADH:ubiquinone oxidoreductase [Phycisphaerales bacterium]|nr:MAG: NADH:ubiquinone oxidoreductase [Phycisphaerales bacterium]
MKPKVAIFSLTGCEGCSLAILELEDRLLDILDAVEVVNFREGMTERTWDIDIGFVDGAVSTPQDETEVRHIREHCTTLVAIGACACLGGLNTLKNHQPEEDYRRYVYGDRAEWFPTITARPISSVVKVDYELPGCPMIKEEFLRFVTHALAGRTFTLPDHAVCVECKKRGNLCLYEKGEICLGPMTRAGCDAICPTYGSKCEACRGILNEDVLKAAGINLREQYNVELDDVLADLQLFGAYQAKALP